MIAMRNLCLLLCCCFVIVNSQSTVQTSGECSNDDEYVLQTVERTCRPTQQLLRLHKHLLNQVSAKLMSIESLQITSSGMDVEKKHLVSALTGKYTGKLPVI